MNLNIDEKQNIYMALNYWANYIETGNIVTSAKDAQNTGKKHKVLETSQMKKVIFLRDLAEKILITNENSYGDSNDFN